MCEANYVINVCICLIADFVSASDIVIEIYVVDM